MHNFSSNYGIGAGAPQWIHVFGPWLILLVLWSLFWKGLALWHAARRGQVPWFAVLLVLNTAGLFEIVYLFLILKLKWQDLFKK